MQPITDPIALFSSAWNLFKKNWKILALIAVTPSVGSFIGELGALTHSIVPAVIGGLISLASAIFSIAMGPAIVNAIHRLSTESGVVLKIKDQYKVGFGFFWSVVLIGIINGLVFFGSVFLLVIPAIIVTVYASLYVFTLVIDGKKGFSALTESYSLVKGRWWPVFGRMMFLALVMLIFWLILAGLGFVLGIIFGIHAPIVHTAAMVAPTVGGIILGFIINIVQVSVLVPIVIAYLYGLYTSLKATRVVGVETNAFKKWLVAFICVGVIAVIASAITVPIVVFTMAKREIESNKAAMQINIQRLQQSMKQASTTGPILPE